MSLSRGVSGGWVCVCGCVLSPSAFSKSTRHFELLVNREHTQLTTWPHTHTHAFPHIPHTQKQCTMNEKFKACCIIKWKALENYRGQRGQNLKSTGELWRQTKALAFPLSPYLPISHSLSHFLSCSLCVSVCPRALACIGKYAGKVFIYGLPVL